MDILIGLTILFAIIGIILSMEYLLKAHSRPYIIISLSSDADRVEGIIRSARFSYPYSEIIVIDYGLSGEADEILNKLCADYDCIHRKKA